MKYIFWILVSLFLIFFWVFFVWENNLVLDKNWKTLDLPTKLTWDNTYISKVFLIQKDFELSSNECIKNVSLNWKSAFFVKCEKNISLNWNLWYNQLQVSLKKDWNLKNFEINKDILNYLFLLVLFFSLFSVFQNKIQNLRFFWLIILFFSTRLFLISNIDYKTYSRDYDWHLEYINYIKDHFSLPEPLGWQTHQLPWYYFVAWAVSKISENIGVNQYLSLQILASLFSLWTFFFFYKILWFFSINQKNKILILVFMISFWGIWINTIKIWNDPASYFGFMMFLYFLLKFGKNPTYNQFLALIFCAILAIYMKKTNMLVLPILAIYTTYIFANKFFSSKNIWNLGNKNLDWNEQNLSVLKKYFLIGFSSLIFVLVSLLPRLNHISKYNQNFLMATPPSVQVADRLKVKNEPSRYYFPDLKTFFSTPYTSTADDQLGRNNFWEFLTKTAFWWEFQYSKNIVLMRLIMILTLMVWVISTIYFFLNLKTFWLLWISIILWIASLLYFFFWHTYACNQDFRYILPVAFLWAIIFSHAMQKYKLQLLVYMIIFLNFLFMYWILN